ncbi:phospholipid carrier-dependent glycosyltransferase, partial [Candidatus Curtissbacteria bacterium]|nr:phospholipid carrier-dependent glycosyltransferase [Candidatus Curtissbacteria bacterium]
MQSRLIIFISILTIFSLVIRFYRLTEPEHYYFDEVYHAVTAKAYADNDKAAYDPFSPAPKEGTAYDWLHPPLAKLIQAGSIKIFGDVPFGWRLPSVIFGTAIIPLTFILTNLLFGPTAAVFASTVLAFENLTFVMSRITMNDVFMVFWILLSLIFAILAVRSQRLRYLVLTSAFLGLAVATKWSALYAIIAVASYIFFAHLRGGKALLKLSSLITIPALIYLASYGQFWLQGHSISQFVDLHR